MNAECFFRKAAALIVSFEKRALFLQLKVVVNHR